MKAVVQNMKTGALSVDDVPPPSLKPDGVLVAVRRSLISLGTERAIIALAKKGPIGKAKDRPDLARKVMNKAKQEGLWNTYQVVKNLLASPIPLGYSSAGEVIEVGARAPGFRVGDRVACAGLNYANHAEIDYIPRNLAVPMPDGLSYESASFVAVGAIAMQGVRLAKLELGETVVVMGLGLVGQVAAQLVRCSGANVIANDLDPEKTALAEKLGAHHAVAGAEELARTVADLTGGQGADAVIICAATKSEEPIRLAAEISRLKGRVVLVGDVGLKLDRRAFFEKEISFTVSRSYGPGRYDPAYERHGTDYPLPYVRWTEGRNMESFLELVARGQVDLESLVSHRFPVEKAEEAYDLVTGKNKEPAIAIVLGYENADAADTVVKVRETPAKPTGKVNLGVIGAGQFAKGVLLPAFAKQSEVSFRAFCTASGLTSKSVAERYGADYCTSDAEKIIADDTIDTVLIATRHDHHAALVESAIRAGKAVFVEKPLALDEESLARIEEAYASAENPRLMVGFNRRFSPLAIRMKEFFAGRESPLFAYYRVNAGSLPSDSWATDPIEGGGRILGEGCHFVDMMCFLFDCVPVRVFAQSLGASEGQTENEAISITLAMADGSVGVIHYLAGGDTSVPKEFMEAYGGGRTAILDNFRQLALHQDNRRKRKRLLNQAKGHVEEVAAFVSAIATGKPMPIDFETQTATTRATFWALESLEQGVPVDGRAIEEERDEPDAAG